MLNVKIRKNKRRKAGGFYLQPTEPILCLEDSYEQALNAASLEGAEGIYDLETLEKMVDRQEIIDLGLSLILAAK